MNARFVDTGVLYAYLSKSDRLHRRAIELIDQAELPMVTIWPVIWETITLASRQLGGRKAAVVGRELISGNRVRILELTTADHVLAMDALVRFDNLVLSATDVTACGIVRRLGIVEVASFDRHFQLLLPDRAVLGNS